MTCGWPLASASELAEALRDAQDRARGLAAGGYTEHAKELREAALRRVAVRLQLQLCDLCAGPNPAALQ